MSERARSPIGMLGEERYVVSPEAGTTRDAVDTPLRYNERTLVFIDTAGLRRKSKIDDDVEFYSSIRTQQAIERADVCVLVVDAALGMHIQDLRIATEAWDRGAGLIVAVNKWDLIEEKDSNTAARGQEALIEKAPFLQYVPFVYVSALTGTAGAQDLRPDHGSGRRETGADQDGGSEQGSGRAGAAPDASPARG